MKRDWREYNKLWMRQYRAAHQPSDWDEIVEKYLRAMKAWIENRRENHQRSQHDPLHR